MKRVAGTVIASGVAGWMMCALWAQDNGQIKAREAFWFRPQAQANTTTPKTTPAKTKASPTGKTVTQTTPPDRAVTYTPVTTPDATNAQATNPPSRQGGDGQGNTHIVKVDYAPLALRYSILQKKGGSFVEVDPDTEFHTGDLVRVRVEANDSAYLYIVMGGSSGNWKVLFPDKEIGGGNNHVDSGHPCIIPPESDPPFRFDETAGIEKISLILSRNPEQDLEKLIYAAGDRSRNNGPRTMMAQASPIDNALMGQMRDQLLSRDLVFEKYDGKTPDGKEDKALYAATPDKSPNARLFVDLQLTHK